MNNQILELPTKVPENLLKSFILKLRSKIQLEPEIVSDADLYLAFQLLSNKRKQILILYYLDGKTLEEIASMWKTSAQGIREIITNAIDTIEQYCKNPLSQLLYIKLKIPTRWTNLLMIAVRTGKLQINSVEELVDYILNHKEDLYEIRNFKTKAYQAIYNALVKEGYIKPNEQ